MFGYVKPFKPDLKISEFELYKSVYCRLCRHMGKNFGIKSRMLLSYDCTFIAMIAISLNEDQVQISRGRCVSNCLKKCNYFNGYDKYFDFAAAIGIITSYYKIQDNIVDSSFIKKILPLTMKSIFYSEHKNAAKGYPELEKVLQHFFSEQQNVESKKNNHSIDVSAHPTSEAVSKIMSLISPSLKNFGYFLGRWVYIIDAADDIIKDTKQNNFNPLKCLKHDKLQINEILNQTVFQILDKCKGIDFKSFDPIIKNILKLGLADMQRKVLFEKREN